MANNCIDNRLLLYNGTSQAQRILDVLLADCPHVDERTTADLILLTKRYSAFLNFYDLTNAIAGDWQGQMSNDVVVTIAAIADWKTQDFAAFIKNENDNIINATTNTAAKKYFKVLFDFVFSLAAGLDKAFKQLPTDIDYYTFLSVSIGSKLSAPLSILFQYYNVFKAASLIDETSTFTDPLTPVDALIFSQNFQISSLSAPFIINPPVTAYPISLTGVVQADIDHILTHNLFSGAYKSFIDGITNIVSRTPAFLTAMLENYPSHAPHYALYLTFLKLFSFAQQHLNLYTKKHLDFYYKQVLGLTNNAAEADFVHLVFTLQKNINQHLLPAGTTFKAGKDANKNDLFYAITDDLVAQTANVQLLKSIYLNKDKSPVALFASPTANSEDGQGGKLLSTDGSWFPFGNSQNIKPAQLGFAVASNALYLNEGNRTIDLIFKCNSSAGITAADLSGIFTIQLTGSKGWYTVASYTALILSSTSFSLSVTLQGDEPPIIPYSAKLHPGNFNTVLPMAQVTLTSYASYQKIKLLRVTGITVGVTVNAVKNLSLQNDDGKINTAKPFKLFGDFPDEGASFIIGSKEVFQKQLTELSINFEWQQVPLLDTTVTISSLVKGNWAPIDSNAEVGLYAADIVIAKSQPKFIKDPLYLPYIPPPAEVDTIGLLNIAKSPADFTADEDYSITSIDGFIKLELVGGEYNLSTFLKKIPPPSVNVIYDGSTPPKVSSYQVNTGTMPVAAPPLVKSFSINYSAEDDLTFANSSGAFNARSSFYYHIEPFGYREMHPFITTDALTFLPVFNLDDNTTNDDGGELWIGINAIPDETFSILFQVSDGSANPLKNMTTVSWYYMSNNNWVPFKAQAITDQSNNLTRSGLVILNVPGDATVTNTRADNNLIWVKAVVNHDTDAVCNLIAVDANAAKAQFVQDPSKNIAFTKTLPPGTISKPAVADAALKQTQQPYSSFGGRVLESDDQFYVRVSERLRHKHRAITSWDYERLTLQYFPQIFKVKAIDHTGFLLDEKTNTQKYSETLPGHVMVITIPDLTNLNTSNPLRPYTSIGLLTEIENYLKTLTSPFVRLRLCNPQFEEVQFDFSVTFHENFDPVFFTGQLNDDIEQFLTPWAFGNPQAIEFGNRVEKSVVLNFIEERYYVDFVTCFQMNQIIRDGTTVVQAFYNIEEAVASTARSILVSYYNEEKKIKHLISTPANCDCNG